MNKIIVVVGMCGVGKTVACDYLESLGLDRIYFGAITFEKLQEEALANVELEDLKVSSYVIKDALDEEKNVTLKRSKGEKSNGKS